MADIPWDAGGRELNYLEELIHDIREGCPRFKTAEGFQETRDEFAHAHKILTHQLSYAWEIIKEENFLLAKLKNPWIKCGEKMPVIGKPVLVYYKAFIFGGNKKHEMITVDWRGGNTSQFVNAAPFIVTHWMPLPPPPQNKLEPEDK